jgi:hypothetical protein
MSDKSFVKKLRRIFQENEEEHRSLICQKDREARETLVAKFQTQRANHASHFGVANLTPL